MNSEYYNHFAMLILSNRKDDKHCIWLSWIEVLTYSSAHNYFKFTTIFGINLDIFFDNNRSLKSMIFITPGETTLRVKGFAPHLGAGVVGIAKINPQWVSVSKIFAAFAKNACAAVPPILFLMEISTRSTALIDGS
jgi:hypothetical protein